MVEISFETAWRRDDPEKKRVVRDFWLALDVLGPEHVEERVNDLCSIAYSNGNVIAVSSAKLMDFPRLRSRFAFYRTAVSPKFRRQNLASRLCVYSRDMLARWAREHPEEKVKGLFIVLEADEFRRHQHIHLPIGHQLGLDLVLVGYTPSGHQMRVVWFDDATVE